jgi:pimeloyl-ACP methyl ester carboxylesterase
VDCLHVRLLHVRDGCTVERPTCLLAVVADGDRQEDVICDGLRHGCIQAYLCCVAADSQLGCRENGSPKLATGRGLRYIEPGRRKQSWMVSSTLTRAIYLIVGSTGGVAMLEVQLSAGTIEYEDTGGPGPVLVLLHGLIMDGSLWRHVVADLRSDCRCVLPTLPLGGHRHPMRRDADLSMRGIAELVGEFMQSLELRDVTLAMNDWGGAQLLIGGAYDERISRLALCACEAFDNVPPQGAARMLPYIARIPGGIAATLMPFRFDRLRRLPLTYGHLSKRPVPREVMDGWFGPALRQREIRRDLRKYVLSSAQGRRDLLAATSALGSFDRPALVAWASEDRLMPIEHGRRLARLFPQGQLVEIADSYTLIPEDQPAVLAGHIRELLWR